MNAVNYSKISKILHSKLILVYLNFKLTHILNGHAPRNETRDKDVTQKDGQTERRADRKTGRQANQHEQV